MPYKTIHVDGKHYEYFVGPKNIMIKGLGKFPKERCGNHFTNPHDCDKIQQLIREVVEEILK